MTHPTPYDKLIIGKFGQDLVATINWAKGINNDHTLAFLIIGYKQSYKILLDEALKVPAEKPVDMDFLINPILFCLRHYVELSLKDTIRTLNIALQLIKVDEVGFPQTHDIKDLFSNLQEIFLTHKVKFNAETITDDFFIQQKVTENIIKELSSYDQFSFSFRYPFKKSTKETEKIKDSISETSIDLKNLKEVGEKLIFTLEQLNSEANFFENSEYMRINYGIE